MEKRGMSHIEIILSFVLFISAVVFIFSIFNVKDVTRSNDSSLARLDYEISKAARTDVQSISVAIKESWAGRPVIAINIGEAIPAGKNVRVESYSGDLLPSRVSSSRSVVYVEKNDEKFFRILVSNDLPENSIEVASEPALDESQYIISSRDSLKMLSEKRFSSLKERYEKDYQNLKKEMKISSRLEFAFGLEFAGESIKAEKDIPLRSEVSVKSKREEVLRSDGTREFADYTLKLW